MLINEKESLESSGYKQSLKLEMTESTPQQHAEVLLFLTGMCCCSQIGRLNEMNDE